MRGGLKTIANTELIPSTIESDEQNCLSAAVKPLLILNTLRMLLGD